MPSYARTSPTRRAARLSALVLIAAGITMSPLAVAHADAMTVTSVTSSDFTTTNAASSKPTLTIQGTNIPSDATLRLTPTFAGPTDPNAIAMGPPITAPATTVATDGTQWTGAVVLGHVTAGDYNVELVSGQTSAACSCTFTIASAGPPSPGPVVRPATAAQGSSFVLKIPDDAATPGASVSFSDQSISVTGPAHFGTASDCGTGRCILVPITVAPDATVGDKSDVIVTDLPASSSDTTNVGKCAGCLTLTAAPTLDSLDPATLGQGATTTLTINGSNFADAATVTFGAGVSSTDKPTVSSSKITVPVKVAPDAPSTVHVTVTNPDFGTAGKDLTTDAGPTLTKTSPQYVGTAFTGTLTLTGTNYHSSATVSFPTDAGVTTSGSPTVSADGTTVTVPIKVQRTSPTAVDVTVSNADDKGSAACTGCLDVAVAPSDVTNLAATRTGTDVTVAWSAVPTSDSGGAPISGYAVSVLQPANSGIKPQTVTDANASFTGLSATLNYTFKVVAINAAKLKSPGVIASTGGQDGGTTLTLTSAATSLVTGQHVTLSGHLANAAGDPIAGASILVSARDATGRTSAIGTTTTDPDGKWSLAAAPRYTVAFGASFAGDDQNATASSSPLRVTVAPRVTISALRSSPSAQKLLVTGKVSPNKAGRTVHLTAIDAHGAKKDLGTATLSGGSSYSFKVRLGKGTWTLVARIGASSGNTAGRSKGLRVKRT